MDGLFTHLACADCDKEATHDQINQFRRSLAKLPAHIRPRLRHVCNSAGILAFRDGHFDVVRPGLALYGHPPSPEFAGHG